MADQTGSRGQGRIFQRGAVWWASYYRNGKEIRESTNTTDRDEAEKHLHTRREASKRPKFDSPQAKKLRFEDLCDLVRQDYKRKRNRSSIESKLAQLAKVFAGDRALTITTARIDQYIEAREAAKARPATINRELEALRRAFRLAVKKDLLPTMPAVTLLPEDNAREGFIDPAEFAALLAELTTLGAPDVADAAEFAYLTCLRRGNVLGACWTWFTLEVDATGAVVRGSVRLPGTVTKNKKPLSLALTGPLLAVIARRWTRRLADCPFVFHRDGRPLVRFDGPWATACAAVGLPGLLFHDLRRSGARNLRRAGVDQHVIQRIGGWKTASMFKRYDIVDERDLRDAGERLATYLATETTTAPTVVPLRRRS